MMEQRERSTGSARRLAGLALAGCLLVGAGPTLAAAPSQVETLGLTPTRAATAVQRRCGPARMSTPGIECRGWDGTDVTTLTDLFVVGFENNQELGEKHVLQAVATFDLSPLAALPADAKVAKASLGYAEASTTRRSASGDSEYGILPTCNTRLGVPTTAWGGGLDTIVSTTPAKTAGHAGATTAESGAWDVTPQIEQWVKDKAAEGTFVLRPEDESMDPKGQQLCLSYVINLALDVEYELPR
jgi:hypothetical protein